MAVHESWEGINYETKKENCSLLNFNECLRQWYSNSAASLLIYLN
jgi:hypothetical protein